MDWKTYALYVLVMAGVTYLTRMIPLVAVRGKIKNRFVLSFLAYVPYAVLSAMTFPAVFSSVGSLLPAVGGTLVAMVLGWQKKPLLTVAAFACAAAFLLALAV